MSPSTSSALMGCVTFVLLVSVLSGCGGVGTGIPVQSVPLHLALVPSLASEPTAGAAGAQPRDTAHNENEPKPPGSAAAATDATTDRPPRRTDGSTGSSGSRLLSGDTDPGEGPPSEVPPPSEADNVTETTPSGSRLAGLPRNNPEAADLLDHWGHRRSGTLAEGLDLSSPVSDGDAAYLRTLRTAVQEGGGSVTAGSPGQRRGRGSRCPPRGDVRALGGRPRRYAVDRVRSVAGRSGDAR